MEMITGFGRTILPTQSNKIKWEKEREKAKKVMALVWMAIFVKAPIEASTHNVIHVWMCKLSCVVNFHDYYHQIPLKNKSQ